MSEPGLSMRGVNLGLAVGLAILVVCGGLLLLGPGRGHLARARDELRERFVRVEGWTEELTGFRMPDADERIRWQELWQSASERIAAIGDEPELTAQVAQLFEAPSVVQLEVVRVSSADDREESEDSGGIELRSPTDGEQHMVVDRIPLRAGFRSNYRDAAEVLGRLEARGLPLLVESLEMRRDYPGVAVSLELTYFSRRPS